MCHKVGEAEWLHMVVWLGGRELVGAFGLQSVHSKFDKIGPILRLQQLFNHNANN